jgi:membrane protein implicated in regulation of membrane protease activity
MSSKSRSTLQRYVALQIPGAVLVGFLLVALHYAELLSLVTSVAFFIGWCAKDALMYRFVRSAYEPGPPHGTAALVGQSGVVVRDLDPKGLVRLSAEEWSAQTTEESETLDQGTPIRVVSVSGFVVTVVREGGD